MCDPQQTGPHADRSVAEGLPDFVCKRPGACEVMFVGVLAVEAAGEPEGLSYTPQLTSRSHRLTPSRCGPELPIRVAPLASADLTRRVQDRLKCVDRAVLLTPSHDAGSVKIVEPLHQENVTRVIEIFGTPPTHFLHDQIFGHR